MKTLGYIKTKEKRAVWKRAFRMWQRRPHQVAPLSEETHVCTSCGTVFQGNFCPRCGQSQRVGRFSFKKSLLLFLDVWGMGNRGMFRSIRDLMLRPGYMIRDYLSGMQSAYFPPFKMFFLLAALSLLVEHGFNLSFERTVEEQSEVVSVEVEEGEEISPAMKAVSKVMNLMGAVREKNAAIFSLLLLIVFALPLYFFIRRSPSIPDMYYSEYVVALVYTSNASSIYSIASEFLGLRLLNVLSVLIVFVSFRQLSGLRTGRILAYMGLTAVLSVLLLLSLIAASASIVYLCG